jgi:hypothetical protein
VCGAHSDVWQRPVSASMGVNMPCPPAVVAVVL